MSEREMIVATWRWCAANAEHLESNGADTEAAALRRLVNAWVEAQRRKLKRRPATLEEISTLRHAVRAADLVLDYVVRQYPGELTGWNLQCTPANGPQSFYGAVHALALELGIAVASMEAQLPKYALAFRQQRAEYAQQHQAA